jgi:hypothetical protein
MCPKVDVGGHMSYSRSEIPSHHLPLRVILGNVRTERAKLIAII